MHPLRKQRLLLIILLLSGITAAVGFALYALKQNINLFFTPNQIVAGQAPQNHVFRLGGLVEKGSVKRQVGSLQTRFIVTDNIKQISVSYTGILPDLFREGQGVVAEGKLSPQGVFVADQVLAKHDEKYMPPQVAAALAQKA